MTKFYEYGNATRRLKSGKFTFQFDVVEQVAGNWRGVLKLEDEESQVKFLSLSKAKKFQVRSECRPEHGRGYWPL